MAIPQDALLRPGDLDLMLRLLAAALAGAVIGWNRFRHGKPAGVGTHALVAVGAALFVAAAMQVQGPTHDGYTRVVQGIATGIGFVGAGEIFRDAGQDRRVHGLTSAAALWVTAALGAVAGCGSLALTGGATLLTLLVVELAPRMEGRGSSGPGAPGQR
jgi:putative Mg2+ transporter-C (MgtC) family protein